MSAIHILGLLSMAFVAAFTVYGAFYASHHGGQTPRDAILEAWKNIVIGFSLNFVVNLMVFPAIPSMGHAHISLIDNFMIGWIYTAVSILRTYGIRRWHNLKLVKQNP